MVKAGEQEEKERSKKKIDTEIITAYNLFCSHIYSQGIKIQSAKYQECQNMKSCERQANYSHQLTDGKTETMADQQVQNRGKVIPVHLSPPPHHLGLKHN